VRAVFVPAEEQDPGVFPQVGYAVSRQCGGAVVRNRLRRRMREVARQCASDLPRGRYLLRLDAAAAETPPAAFRTHVAQALYRAAGSGGPSARPSSPEPSSVTR
jgi:ribonuclease P protein component